MRIVWLITAGSFLVSVTISENDVPISNNVQRVPRALVLQPMITVNTEDDDDGPFDFISNWLKRIIHPPKKASIPQMQMLGPIRVPGLNDDVYIKQLQPMSHRNRHVVIKVMNNDPKNLQMSMPLEMNTYQNQNFPMSSTRQMPMMSGGFQPVSSPTSNPSWAQQQNSQYNPALPYANNIHQSQNNIMNDYKNNQNHFRNFRNVPGHSNGFIPNQSNQQHFYNRHQHPWQPQQYYSQYQSASQSFYPHHDSSYRPQTGYGSYDFHNSIPGTSGSFSNYRVDSREPRNNSRHPIHQDDANYKMISEENEAINEEDSNADNSKQREKVTKKIKYKDVDLPKVTPTSAKASTSPTELIEIYRSDRMVPTNPSYRNRFWTRALKTSMKVTSTTERVIDDETDGTSKQEYKYSSRSIEEIPAPDLKTWKESINHEDNEEDSDSRMDDDDEIIVKAGTTLGKGELQDYIDENSSDTLVGLTEPSNNDSKTTSRNSRNWKPIESSKREVDDIRMRNSSTRVESITPEVIKKPTSLTASNSWRYRDVKKSSKISFPRLKNRKRNVRIVESVKSSVSMTSSKGVKKPKSAH